MEKTKWTWVCTTGLALLDAVVLLGGYGPKRGQLMAPATASATTEQGKGQDTVIYGGIRLNFDEAQSSYEDLLKDNVGNHPLSKYIDIVVDGNNKTTMLIWPLDNAATEGDGVRYANELIRVFNDAYAEQDFSIAVSSGKSYGGLYQEYAASIQILREADILRPGRYLVSTTIPADSNQAVVPFSQYDGVNEVILADSSVKVPDSKYTGDQAGLYGGE